MRTTGFEPRASAIPTFALFALFALYAGVFTLLDNGRIERENFAEWTSEGDYRFIAVGNWGRIFLLETKTLNEDCDGFEDEVLHDRNYQIVRDKLRELGFTSLECGDTQRAIPSKEMAPRDADYPAQQGSNEWADV